MDIRVLSLALLVFVAPVAKSQDVSEGKKLRAIVDEYGEGIKRVDSFSADYFSVEEDLDKFGDYPTDAYYGRLKNIIKTGLDKIQTVNYEKLTEAEKVDYRIFKVDLETANGQFKFPFEFLDFHQMGNRLNSFMDQANPSITSFPFDNLKHYEAFLKRSEGFPAYIDAEIAILKKGIEKKVTQSCIVVEKTANAYKNGLTENVEKNPFYLPTTAFPKNISKKDQERLRAEFKQMITTRIIPGFKKFNTFFQGEYKEHCRKEFGIGGLPNAKEMYAYAIRAQTDTEMPAEKIHAIGIKEVTRIEAEMAQVQKQLKIEGTRQEFLQSLLKEDKFFFKDEKQLVSSFTQVRAEIKKALPKYFSLIPKTDFTIVPTSNPEDAAGIYHNPTDLNPVGKFVYNATQIRQIPKYEVATLLMHETVPGHHLQLALAFEMKDRLSEYRRKVFNSTAFIEGWALYSESLGQDMGIYKDPMFRLGNLNDELLRAVRLVVDTGIHSMGWTKDQTVAYMTEHLATDPSDINIEAVRYSVLVGQALAYKVGQLKILELRDKAKTELASNFDIRDFHRAVIGSGTLSLPVLEEQVDAYVKETKANLRKPTSNQ
jgi:uncharacterized protein (DUF885 family)